ncbi:hypothetical protein [Muriicola marianensis]|uniref:hypothetical protein n=1 Tax=Muriicola marianensis TaxID=1324801 RepID=UPI001668E22B|nr:hypothetical protein [Muriicola marianensis]
MQVKRFTSVIALLLLGIFLGIKSLDYHPLTHAQDDDRVKCELCAFSLLHESTSFDQVTFSTAIPVLWSGTHSDISQALVSTKETDRVDPTLFGRPPPAIG